MGRAIVLHPDLGLGGAERLIVDASMALQDSGHRITIYTGYHDPNRCFRETVNGRLNVVVIGSKIPRSIFGRLHALLAYIKMIYIAFFILLFTKNDYDLVLCDQVSACIPLFKVVQLFKQQLRIVFYCHFPDQLLTARESFLKRIYRKPIDMFEEWSTNLADKIVVNSNFTSKVVKRTFSSLYNRNLIVLYPCVDVNQLARSKPSLTDCNPFVRECVEKVIDAEDSYVFLSLNRFERKKDIRLAIEALQKLQSELDNVSEKRNKMRCAKQVFLFVAGGYDERLTECVDYYSELADLVSSNKYLEEQVMFIRSPDENEKLMLLRTCDAVIYTPENEHFGIVPIEAMAMSKPVIASSSGGPLETIVDSSPSATGKLCEHTKDSFANAMLSLSQNRELSRKLGSNGLKRVQSHFSYEIFSKQINRICFDSAR